MALKKVFQARAHRERSQPAARQRLGLLEKHADYVLRARDFQKKENRLKVLKQKAVMKNPDEFYFGMINAKTSAGIHSKHDTTHLPVEVLKLLKSQDLTYVQMLKNVNLKKLDRLKAELPTSLVKNNTASDSNHIYFAETKDEKQTMLESRMIQSAIPIDLEKESTSSTPSRALLEYQIRQERLEKLALAETKLQNQKHIMQPGRRKITKVDEYGHPVFKWKAERKK